MPLPARIEDLKGKDLRAARWIRESTKDQMAEGFGPDSQMRQQDFAVQKFGFVDTGLKWSAAHSGRSIDETPEWSEMVARAGIDYDVLLVGYVSRLTRNYDSQSAVLKTLHAAGAVIYFCDDGLLSSDDERWEQWARELVEAEAYSRRLARRVRQGYEAKFQRFADQAGTPPIGFKRSKVKPCLMEIDLTTIDQAVHLYERYSTGTVSIRDLVAETGLEYERINKVLRNPLYNGWARRHRGQNEERLPSAWRANPPVSDDLWNRVAEQRSNRTHAGGKRSGRIDPLTGLIFCTCGVRVRSNGLMGTPGRPSRMHFQPCGAWGKQGHYASAVWEEPIFAQIAGIDLSDRTIERVVRILSKGRPEPVSIDKARNARRRRQLANCFAEGRITLEELGAAIEAIQEGPRAAEVRAIDPAKAVEYLRNIPLLLAKATPAEKAELLHGIYERIEVNGPAFVGVTLTTSAYAAGLALSLPESVSRNWRPRQGSNLRPTA